MTTIRAVLVVFLILLAGCTTAIGPPRADSGPDADVTAADNSTTDPAGGSAPGGEWTWPADPPADRLGWEAGYWYNESIAVNQSDGLNESERAAFVGRTMARIEEIRGLEFTDSVPVEVVTREEYRNSTPFSNGRGPAYSAWNNQVWESLLLVGEDENVTDVMNNLYDGSVLGYYAPGKDRIVVVSDADEPVIRRSTLSHELMHALQDQQFGMPPAGETQDSQLARNGIVEGDARYVERLYEERCGVEWECVPNPPAPGGGGGSIDMGVYVTIYTPYSEGPTLVSRVRERGGWAAVNDVYRNVPASTEQLIHPNRYPDEKPVRVRIPDRSSSSWSRLDVSPQADTVGEASLFAMLWSNGGIDQSHLRRNTGTYSAYNYSAHVTTGWAGDSVVPYRSDDGEYGYVLRIEWDTARDAKAFVTRYENAVLRTRHGATEVEENTFLIKTGPFADAFRVTRDGSTVTVVNAPTAPQLDDVHAE